MNRASAQAGCIAICVALGATPAAGGNAQPNRPVVTLGQAARQLDAAAHLARSHRGNVKLPELHVSPQVDRWLAASLAAIQKEKPQQRARDLQLLAGSVRRLAAQENGANEFAPATYGGRANEFAPATYGGGANELAPATYGEPQTSVRAKADPKAVAALVLAQRAYHQPNEKPASTAESFWERFFNAIGTLLARIFQGILSLTSASPLVGNIVALALVVLLIAVIAYAIARLVSSLSGIRPSAPLDDGLPLAQAADPDVLYQSGMDAARAGLHAKAVALLFQASLAYLDQVGSLPLDASLTPSECRRAVRRTKAAAAPYFDTIAQSFVMAAFAERPLCVNDWTAAETAYGNLRAVLAS